MALLIGVYAFGTMRHGARRWLDLGPIQFQPSELAKLTFLFASLRRRHVFAEKRDLLVETLEGCFASTSSTRLSSLPTSSQTEPKLPLMTS
jgi:cell division protein FtsW (lipid II flippase)